VGNRVTIKKGSERGRKEARENPDLRFARRTKKIGCKGPSVGVGKSQQMKVKGKIITKMKRGKGGGPK